MNLKLENIKTALRLVIEQAESRGIFAKETPYEADIDFRDFSVTERPYIATACNMGAPMAKGMLVAIALVEQQIADGNLAPVRLTEILAAFSDPETTNTEAKQ